MGVNAVSYPFRVMVFYVYLFLKRFWDRKLTLNKKKTRCRSQKDYEKMYMGAEFSLEWRYAQVFLIIKFEIYYTLKGFEYNFRLSFIWNCTSNTFYSDLDSFNFDLFHG